MSDDVLIFAKVLDEKQGVIEYEQLDDIETTTSPIWFHFDANHPDAFKVIQNTFTDIDEYTLQAIFDHDARPRTLLLDSGILLILRGINHNEGDEPEDMVAVRLWANEKRLISLRYRKSKALMKVSDSIVANRGPKSIGDIVTSISARMFSYIEISIGLLDERMDLIESRILDNPDKQLRQDISEVRKSAIMLRRYIAPQKEAINQLRYSEATWLSAKNLRRVQESQDTLLRGIEELDAIRERSQIVKDELVNALSDKLNRNLYVISVITAIFLPLGFLTGLFGINIGGMPGVDKEMAFTIFSGCLAVIVAIQIILFKYFRWF
jgi:zinc transporter